MLVRCPDAAITCEHTFKQTKTLYGQPTTKSYRSEDHYNIEADPTEKRFIKISENPHNPKYDKL